MKRDVLPQEAVADAMWRYLDQDRILIKGASVTMA
jgi:hypothetical protein